VVALTNTGVNIEAVAMLATTDGAKFAEARARLLLGILRSVEEVGARLAQAVQIVEVAPLVGATRAESALERSRNGSGAPHAG